MTAKETYKQKLTEIQQQIKFLKEKLVVHSKKFKNDDKNWGYVGDIGEVKSKLSELDGFMDSI